MAVCEVHWRGESHEFPQLFSSPLLVIWIRGLVVRGPFTLYESKSAGNQIPTRTNPNHPLDLACSLELCPRKPTEIKRENEGNTEAPGALGALGALGVKRPHISGGPGILGL